MPNHALMPFSMVFDGLPQAPTATSQTTFQIMNGGSNLPEDNALRRYFKGFSFHQPAGHPVNVAGREMERIPPGNLDQGSLSSPFRQASRNEQLQTPHRPLINQSKSTMVPKIRAPASKPSYKSDNIKETVGRKSNWNNNATEQSTMSIYRNEHRLPTVPQRADLKAYEPEAQLALLTPASATKHHPTSVETPMEMSNVSSLQSRRSENHPVYINEESSNRRKSWYHRKLHHSVDRRMSMDSASRHVLPHLLEKDHAVQTGTRPSLSQGRRYHSEPSYHLGESSTGLIPKPAGLPDPPERLCPTQRSSLSRQGGLLSYRSLPEQRCIPDNPPHLMRRHFSDEPHPSIPSALPEPGYAQQRGSSSTSNSYRFLRQPSARLAHSIIGIEVCHDSQPIFNSERDEAAVRSGMSSNKPASSNSLSPQFITSGQFKYPNRDAPQRLTDGRPIGNEDTFYTIGQRRLGESPSNAADPFPYQPKIYSDGFNASSKMAFGGRVSQTSLEPVVPGLTYREEETKIEQDVKRMNDREQRKAGRHSHAGRRSQADASNRAVRPKKSSRGHGNAKSSGRSHQGLPKGQVQEFLRSLKGSGRRWINR